MGVSEWVTVITGVFQGSGVAVFVWMLIRGLQRKISALNSTIEMQNKTLDVMERRITETEKINDAYKCLLKEIPEDVERYKNFLRVTKDHLIQELTEANERKDVQLQQIAKEQLKTVEEQEAIAFNLPSLRDNLIRLNNTLDRELNRVATFYTETLPSLKQSGIVNNDQYNIFNLYVSNRGVAKIDFGPQVPNLLAGPLELAEKDTNYKCVSVQDTEQKVFDEAHDHTSYPNSQRRTPD